MAAAARGKVTVRWPGRHVDSNGKGPDIHGLRNLTSVGDPFEIHHEINLSDTEIGNASVAQLKPFKFLRSIAITGTKFDAAGVEQLRKLFPKSRILTSET